jgi:hypothetical protein
MSITQMTRFKSNQPEQMVNAYKTGKMLFEKHGAEWLRFSRFHSGPFTGEWLATSRYADWAAYGKAQEGLANDPDYVKMMSQMQGFSEMTARSIAVGVAE